MEQGLSYLKQFGLYVKRYLWKLWFVNFIGILTTIISLILLAWFLLYKNAIPNPSNPKLRSFTFTLDKIADLFNPDTMFFITVIFLSIAFLISALYAGIADMITTKRMRIWVYFLKGIANTLKLFFIYVLISLPSVLAIIVTYYIVQIYFSIDYTIKNDIFYFVVWLFIIFITPFVLFFMSVHAPLLIIIEQQKTLRALFRSFQISWQNRVELVVTAAFIFFATVFGGIIGLIIASVIIGLLPDFISWIIGFIVILSLCLAAFGLAVAFRYITSFRDQLLATRA